MLMRCVLAAQSASVIALRNSASCWVGRWLALRGRGTRHVPGWSGFRLTRSRRFCAPAILLLVLSLAAWSGGGRAAPTHSPGASAVATSFRSSATPAGLSGSYVIDLTLVSVTMGWALAAAPCDPGLCPRIARTDNGGRSWTALPGPPAYLSTSSSGTYCSRQPCVDHLRFATATIGYLFGPSLLITRNGGVTWTRVTSPPVESLEPGAGQGVRVVYNHDGCPGPCQRKVEAAPAGSEDWRVLLTIGQVSSDAVSSQVVRSGHEAIYVPIYGNLAAGAGTQQTTIFRSLDAGHSWVRLADPCGGTAAQVRDAIDLAAAPGGVIAVLCTTRDGGSFSVRTSTDDGTTWRPRAPVPTSEQFLPGRIAAASATDLAISNNVGGGSGSFTYRLMLSTDGGTHWSTVVSDREQLHPTTPNYGGYLGFQNSLVGRWVGYPHAIWTTTDGGRNWTQRRFS